MRVICISENRHPDCFPPHPNTPQIGDIFTISKVVAGYGISGQLYQCYEFEETKGSEWVYDVNNFAPLSDDEIEVVEELELQEA